MRIRLSFATDQVKTAEDMHLRLEVVDQESGDYDTPGDEGWDFIVVELTPAKIAEYVQNRDGTLLSTACGSGREPLAEAFLKSGYRSLHCPCFTLTTPEEIEDVDLDSSH